jgi:ornithine cyclodeaminase/alanine dehydrogenase-like protein (mu-crystallin family)
MRYLSAADLEGLVPPDRLVAALEQELAELSAGRAAAPPRSHLDYGDNTLLAMPAMDATDVGVKLVSVTPGNAVRGLPVVGGLMLLFDRATATPQAIIDAAALTAQRTGAVGAMGIRHTTPADLDTLGIVGLGAQGVWQAIAACAVRPIRTIHFLARSDASADRFLAAVVPRVSGVRFERSADAAGLLRKASLVITATSASAPLLPDDAVLLRGHHFVAIGSYKPDMQELPDTAFRLAGSIIVDSDAALAESGDVAGPVARGIVPRAQVHHIADVLTGRYSVDVSRTTVFKSVGMALYDLCAARAFLAAAERAGRGRVLA